MSKVEGSKYEELRRRRIAENQARIEALGLSKLANIFKDRIQKAKIKDKKKVNDNDEDYVPEYEGGLGSNSSGENNEQDKYEELITITDLESRKRKMMKSSVLNAKRVYNDPSSMNQSLEKQVKETLPDNASHASELTNVEQVESNEGKHVTKKGRGHTINAKFQKKKEKLATKGKSVDIQFPPPFYKICGKHAKYFKAEAQVCIRQKAPLQVNGWSEISKDDVDGMWRHIKDAFSLSNEVKEYAMKQIQSQYRNKLYHLHQAYLEEKGRPKYVSPEDWDWLIKNKWSGSKFQERSLTNKANRSKQEIKSIIGTKSIVQKAFEMKEDSISGEWPNAMEVWKATHMRSNGTWCIPKGGEIMESLENVGDIYQEENSKAPIPLVEHFAMVLGRKSNHSLGVGSGPVTKKFSQKQIIQNQLENAQNRANSLELEVQNLTNITKRQEDVITQLHIEVQSHRELIETNREQMKQTLENEVKRQIVDILEELSTSESPTKSSAQD